MSLFYQYPEKKAKQDRQRALQLKVGQRATYFKLGFQTEQSSNKLDSWDEFKTINKLGQTSISKPPKKNISLKMVSQTDGAISKDSLLLNLHQNNKHEQSKQQQQVIELKLLQFKKTCQTDILFINSEEDGDLILAIQHPIQHQQNNCQQQSLRNMLYE